MYLFLLAIFAASTFYNVAIWAFLRICRTFGHHVHSKTQRLSRNFREHYFISTAIVDKIGVSVNFLTIIHLGNHDTNVAFYVKSPAIRICDFMITWYIHVVWMPYPNSVFVAITIEFFAIDMGGRTSVFYDIFDHGHYDLIFIGIKFQWAFSNFSRWNILFELSPWLFQCIAVEISNCLPLQFFFNQSLCHSLKLILSPWHFLFPSFWGLKY